MNSVVKPRKSLLPGLVIIILLAMAVWLLLQETSLAFDASVGLEENKKTAVAEKVNEAKGDEAAANAGPSAEVIEKGKQLYGNTCLFCHGPKGVGARAPSLITGHWGPGGANGDDYMMDVIMNGRPGTIMGSFKESHSKEQVEAIIAYLRHEAKLLAEKKAE